MKRGKNGKDSSIIKNRLLFLFSMVFSVLVVLMAITAISAICLRGSDKSRWVAPVNGTVVIKLADVSDGTARFYRFKGKTEIIFFVVKGSDGVFHTAFDACERCCPRSGKGYEQNGDYMICQICRDRYAINMIDQVNGVGCRPRRLEHTKEGDKIIIKVADLNAGAEYFR